MSIITNRKATTMHGGFQTATIRADVVKGGKVIGHVDPTTGEVTEAKKGFAEATQAERDEARARLDALAFDQAKAEANLKAGKEG